MAGALDGVLQPLGREGLATNFPTEASRGPQPGAHGPELLRKAVAFNCSGAGPLAEFELATGVKLTEASGRGV